MGNLSIYVILLTTTIIWQSHGAIRKPKDASELTTFLAKARSGDTIELLPTLYVGSFLVTESSEIPESPITIRGTVSGTQITKLSSPNGTALTVTASNVIFRTMWIVDSERAMSISGSSNELDGITLKDSKEGIVLLSGEKNKLQALTVTNVDIGLILEGESTKDTILRHSSVTSRNISLEVGPDACCNTFDNNVFNGYVNLRSKNNVFNANVANGGMLLTGCGNEFMSNVIQQMKKTKKCENPDKGLNVFNYDADQSFE
jgi:hypothetical protein